METTVRIRRHATPARWKKALERAAAEGLHLYKIAGTGEAVVTSGRLNETVYATDGIDCECEAAMLGGDPVCKHRAVFWRDLGLLNDDASICPELPALRALGWGGPQPEGRVLSRTLDRHAA